MTELTEEQLLELCGMKHYTEWTPDDFKLAWDSYIVSNPDQNEWEFQYRPWPENVTNCKKAFEEMTSLGLNCIWSMNIDKEWITIRVTRPLEELNITL